MKTADRLRKLINESKVETTSQADARILGDALRGIERLGVPGEDIWRMIMKSRMSKVAIVAATVIVAVSVALYSLGSALEATAFAECVRPVLYDRTASFDVALEHEDQPLQHSRFLCMAPGHIRQEKPDGTVHIADYNRNLVLTLNPDEMKAKLQSLNADPDAGYSDVLADMQQRIEHAVRVRDESVESLGRKLIDGREAVGFRVRLDQSQDGPIGWQDKGTFTVWADPDTKEPIRLEWYDDLFAINTIATNISLDVEIDASLFSLEPPHGYALTAISPEQSTATPSQNVFDEQEVVDVLRRWTVLSGGLFPSSLNVQAIKDIDPNADTSFIQKEFNGFEGGIHFATPHAALDPNEPLPQEELNKYLNGVMFIVMGRLQVVMADMDDWSYAGKGVSVGDSDTAILWYRQKGAEACRVVYGDLTVEDVRLEDMP
ncbi:MAG: hypothetical protein JSU70_04155 [Phycisphaerales bacterium]|nr:MAG: hypothetical protein JSU70_04155 [Phycisphaerales bacterium]